jgi:HEPN domain-containing protein
MSASLRTAADDEEEARRATPRGYCEFADSYLDAAEALASANLASPHAQAPVRLMLFCAVELYLKAFLRLHGHSAGELAGAGFGHRVDVLLERASRCGLICSEEERGVFERMAQVEPVVRDRYFRTASYTWPDMAALRRMAERLRGFVGDAVTRAG